MPILVGPTDARKLLATIKVWRRLAQSREKMPPQAGVDLGRLIFERCHFDFDFDFLSIRVVRVERDTPSVLSSQ